MGPTIKDLGIDLLDTSQKIDLALQIWASIDFEPKEGPTNAALHRELIRRGNELDADPDSGITWEEIEVHLDDNP